MDLLLALTQDYKEKLFRAGPDMSSRTTTLLRQLPAVIRELDNVVLVAVFLCSHDHLEKGAGFLCTIYHQPPLEKPMATVLTGNSNTIFYRHLLTVYILP